MNEIKRLQQLAGIITEIKVNNPNIQNIRQLFDYIQLNNKDKEELYNVIGNNWEEFYDDDYGDEHIKIMISSNPVLEKQIIKDYFNK